MKYVLSGAARADLERIWLYTFENWSLEQADRYLNALLDECDYLCRHPNSGTDAGVLRSGYRRAKVNAHFIFYKVEGATIHVVRILHEAMDISAHL